jgi:hypothetical protein
MPQEKKRLRQQPPMIDAKAIRDEAESIRAVVQDIIDACDNEIRIDAYARNVVAGGGLAQNAAALGIMIVAHELEHS